MSDTKNTQDVAVTLGETKAALAVVTAEKTALMSEKDALVASNAALSLRLKEAESATGEATAKLTATEATLALKEAEIAKRDEDALDGSVLVAFETYKDAKKLSDDDKAAMRITLKSDPALFARLYPVVAPGERHLLQNLTGGRTGTDATTQMNGKIPVTRVTVTEPRRDAQAAVLSVSDVRRLTDKLQKDGMTLIQASLEVERIAKGQAPNPLAS